MTEYVIVCLAGVVIGVAATLLWLLGRKLGTLRVVIDETDGQNYLFLELSKDNIPELRKRKHVVLKVDWASDASQK